MPAPRTGRKFAAPGESGRRGRGSEGRDLPAKLVRSAASRGLSRRSSRTSALRAEWDPQSGSEAGARSPARGGEELLRAAAAGPRRLQELSGIRGEDWIALPLGFVGSSGGSCGGCRVSLCPPRTSLPLSVSGSRGPRRRRPSCRQSPTPGCVPGNCYHLSVPTKWSRGGCEQKGATGP